jgi:hypothetical protein
MHSIELLACHTLAQVIKFILYVHTFDGYPILLHPFHNNLLYLV